MKGATSDNLIIPQAEGYLQVPTIQEGKWINVCCYYSPEFTLTLLLDNDVLNSNKFSNEYCGQSIYQNPSKIGLRIRNWMMSQNCTVTTMEIVYLHILMKGSLIKICTSLE